MGLIGGALKAYGIYSDSQDEAAGQERNALTSEMAAGDSLQRGARQEGLARMMASRVQGEQVAAIGTSGVDGPTSMEMLSDSRLISELDAQTIRNNAAREAWGYRVQAAASRYAAGRTRQRGALGAASSILGSLTQSVTDFAHIAGGL